MSEEEGSVAEALMARQRVANLNNELKRAGGLGVLSPEMTALHMRQILNSVQGQIVKADREISTLRKQIHQYEGQKRASARIADLLINQIAAHNQLTERELRDERELAKSEAGEPNDEAEEPKKPAAKTRKRRGAVKKG